ncbi:MAG: hypothetical protein OXH86_17965, partial [Acidimicrobiaceae bacterium]|nr:hypothetical protein [Acidimicrobiaceae bacterium]
VMTHHNVNVIRNGLQPGPHRTGSGRPPSYNYIDAISAVGQHLHRLHGNYQRHRIASCPSRLDAPGDH